MNYRSKEMRKESKKTKIGKQRGITLVALVITIIIIIILATVTINMAFGDNGLIKQAELARDLTANSTIAEQEGMNSLLSDFANLMADDSGTTQPGGNTEQGGDTEPEEPKVPSTTEEAKPTPGEDGPEFTDTTPITDDEGNTVVIPGGFHLDADSGTAVEDGIVIEDSSGNQFVWIPVGTYQTSSGSKTNNLSRRTFSSTGATEVSGDDGITDNSGFTFYGEGHPWAWAEAKDTIEAFKTSSTTNGGFYIGRYEAGTDSERTDKNVALTTPLVQANKYPYIEVTRYQANKQAKAMYSENSYVKSELISSYAWDTALNFICQTNSAGYTLATTTNDTYGNFGRRQNTGVYSADNYSNIHDLLGNCAEWTTEYSNHDNNPCVMRGGGDISISYAADRNDESESYSYDIFSFRIQLYIK